MSAALEPSTGDAPAAPTPASATYRASDRVSAFQTASDVPERGSPSNGTMASSFHTIPQPIRPPGATSTLTATAAAFPMPISTSSSSNTYERDTSASLSSSFNMLSSSSISPMHSVLVRRLPAGTTDDMLRMMTVFSKELTGIELLSPELTEDAGYCSAVLSFESPDGALEAKANLDGKLNYAKDATMVVELINHGGARRPTIDMSSSVTPASSVSSSRGSSRFPRSFQSLEGISPAMYSGNANTNLVGNQDLANAELVGSTSHYQTLFSPQSPIGNHLMERNRVSGKDMINNEAEGDDETRELLQDSLAFADSGSLSAAISAAASTGPQQVSHSQAPRPQHQQQRRATAPLTNRLAGLSLNTASVGSAAMNGAGPAVPPSAYSQSGGPRSAHSMTMSPAGLNGPAMPPVGAYNPRFRQALPPANPADQNPPCNTLYVGNLPMNASEEELKAMFARQRGYKRLCFRTKSNGPMCFVEFEDITCATKALTDLYGKPLHNSFKGGIRLSFSKNPLGVRSGQNPNQSSMVGVSGMAAGMAAGMMPHSAGASAYGMSSGPPPGLAAPPGLNRMVFHSNIAPAIHGSLAPIGSAPFSSGPGMLPTAHAAANGWAAQSHHHASLDGDGGNVNPMVPGGPAASFPSFMMGR